MRTSDERLRPPKTGWQRIPYWHLAASLALAATSSIAILAVQHGLSVEMDNSLARDAMSRAVPFVDGVFPAVAMLWSPEVSLLIGCIGAAAMWRFVGAKWLWIPLGFLALVPVEVILKLAMHRPPGAVFLKPWPSYALANFPAPDAILNGSPMRSGFACLLWTLVLWRIGGTRARLAALVALAIGIVSTLVRIFGPYHWATGEVTGLFLGSALAVGLAGLVPVRHTRGQ